MANQQKALFSLAKLEDGTVQFNVDPSLTTAQATHELVSLAILAAVQQGFVDDDTATISQLMLQLRAASSPKLKKLQSSSKPRDLLVLNKATKKFEEI